MADSSFAFWNFLEFLKSVFNPQLVEAMGAASVNLEGLLHFI